MPVNPFTGRRTEPVLQVASAPGETGYTPIQRHGEFIGYVVTGFGADSIISVGTNIDLSREEAIVVANCRTVQFALEEFAKQNGSLYPGDILYDRNAAGKTVIDLLPLGMRFVNPYTGSRTEPVDRKATGRGETGYEVASINEWDIGYTITGFGESSQIIELTNLESNSEATVRVNCLMVQCAVEDFAMRSGGRYPEDIDSDTTPGGETLVDLLPRSHLLENPYMKAPTNPVGYTASCSGETGYTIVHEYDYYTKQVTIGYVVTGYGEIAMEVVINNLGIMPEDAWVLSNCRTVQLAVEEFAAKNDWIYPCDIDCDCTPRGDTVIDLLPGGRLLENPCTHCCSEPVNCAAANPGEVGFVPVFLNRANRGYSITGVGRTACMTTCILYKPLPDRDSRR